MAVTYDRKIRFSDADAQGVVFNANYLVYWDDTNTDYFEEMGVPWQEFTERGVDMMAVNTTINHRKSAVVGDVVETTSEIAGFGRTSVEFRLVSVNKTTRQVLAEGTQIHVMIDAESSKPTKIPAWFRAEVEEFQGARVPDRVGSKRYNAPPESGLDRAYEDFVVGEWEEFGSYRVTKEEIIEFASMYDPQIFHLDGEAAKDTMFGALVASGWHTGSMMMRMTVEEQIDQYHGMGSPGMDEIRWIVPVFPNDTLRCRTRASDKRPSKSKPDRGVVFIDTEVLNQDDVVVMTAKSRVIYMKRGFGRKPKPS
jgi:YbgC/YbaW family acyl-CoA thioester hydrolase